ncbi:hypothetical protein FQN57_006179 [Myotisia sp. PD_48]|nr:hypothetical protein FQN57_006179 [Myotisia sp. PD_48]
MDSFGQMSYNRYDARALGDVKDTFSDWNKCMTKSYCKWPAIIGIVLASLALLSVLWCIFGCGGRDKSRSKYADEPPQYQSPHVGYRAPAPPVYESQKYAHFDTPTSRPPDAFTGSRVHEDSLPSMPTWENATTRRVMDNSHDMEMNRLDPSTGHAISNDGAIHAGGRGRGGYYEVPDSPGYAQNNHQNQYTHSDPYDNRASIGIAVAHTSDPVYDRHSPYQENNHHNNNSPVYHDTSRDFHSHSPAPAQPSYSTYPQTQPNQYRAYSPATPSSPPPPFSSTNGDHDHAPRAPSLLQAGRRPVENSWRDV